MKVFIEYTQSGMYKDQVWGTPSRRTKGQRHCVDPSEAYDLIKSHRARLLRNEKDELIFVS